MAIRVFHTDLHVLNAHVRMPFRYGIATLTAMPHVFLRLELEVDGNRQQGIAAESLVPKWFTKDPDTSFRDDLAQMFHVIEAAGDIAADIKGEHTVFDLWQQMYADQMKWAQGEGYPPLLWSLGVSLIERAVIDAFCHVTRTPFARAVRDNTLGIVLNEMHGELDGLEPVNLLPPQPLTSIAVRHTVGLGDPFTDNQIPHDQRLTDGLPQSLEASVATYGLKYFKIKLYGDADKDLDRLEQLAVLLRRQCADGYQFTLDGNENYHRVDQFAQLCQSITSRPLLKEMMAHLLFIEQPLHRDVALSADTADALEQWGGALPIIIDESDALVSSLPEALECGYAGTSVKNCKGIFKGIANACLIEHRRRSDPEGTYLISAEDLANIGPVALMQDLASIANLGIPHAERNGHHFLAGLSHLPPDFQQLVLQAHGDLYHQPDSALVTLRIDDGLIDIGSVVDAPYGVAFEFDPVRFTPIDDWRYDSLGVTEGP